MSVLLKPVEARRLDEYCDRYGYKKSTLTARLIRDFLDQQAKPAEKARRGEG